MVRAPELLKKRSVWVFKMTPNPRDTSPLNRNVASLKSILSSPACDSFNSLQLIKIF